ncbi:MAG: extracellular solute-binding protein [Clostridium sp.]|nr:extracellular solute-binding protein [Clostridium sp.]
MKRKWVSKLIALSMTAVIAGSMIGCGGGSSDSSTAPAAEDSAGSGESDAAADDAAAADTAEAPAAEGSSASGDAVTIVYNTNNGDMTKWVIDGYDGEINWVGYAENELDNKILLEMTTGAKTFDMAITQASGAKMFGSLGLLEPLEPLDDMDDIFQGNVEQHSLGDDLYGYPLTGDAMIMYINTEMWEAAGYTEADVPKTLEEYGEKALHLTMDSAGVRGDEAGFNKDDVVQWGTMYMGGSVVGNPWELATLSYGNGAKYILKDYENNTCEVVCNSPEMVGTLQFIKDLADAGAMPEGYVGYDYNEVDAQWISGKIGMFINWPYLLDRCVGTAVEGKVKVYGLPVGSAGKSESCLGGWSVNVFKDAPHKEEALKVAKALANAESNYNYCTLQGSSTARESVIERQNETYKAEGQDILLEVNAAYLESISTGAEMDLAQTNAAANDCQQTAAQYINMALTGQLSCQEAMDQLKAELETILADNDYMQGN